MYDFNACTRLQEVNVHHPERTLEPVQRAVAKKTFPRCADDFPRNIKSVEALGVELEKLGLNPDTTYLYIQGHHLMDGVVMKTSYPPYVLCCVASANREN